MKTKIFSFLLIITAATLFAQVPRGFSIAAGATQSMWKSEDLLADGGLGYAVGIGFNFGYHETYNYEFNLLVNQQVLKPYYVDETSINVSQSKVSMQNISFGGQFNYYFLKPDEDKFYAGALVGVKVNFSTTGFTNKDDNYNQFYLPYRLDISSLEEASKFSYNPTIGVVAGYNKLRLAIKYDIGITNMLKDVQTGQINENGIYTGPSLEGKLSSASLILYYKIF